MKLLYGDLHDQMREYITTAYGDTTWEALLIVYKYFPNFSTSDGFHVSANGVLHSTPSGFEHGGVALLQPLTGWTGVFVNGKAILSIVRKQTETYYVPAGTHWHKLYETNMFEEFLREIALIEIIEK